MGLADTTSSAPKVWGYLTCSIIYVPLGHWTDISIFLRCDDITAASRMSSCSICLSRSFLKHKITLFDISLAFVSWVTLCTILRHPTAMIVHNQMMSYKHLTVKHVITFKIYLSSKKTFTALSSETDKVTSLSNVITCNFKEGNHVVALPLIHTRDFAYNVLYHCLLCVCT